MYLAAYLKKKLVLDLNKLTLNSIRSTSGQALYDQSQKVRKDFEDATVDFIVAYIRSTHGGYDHESIHFYYSELHSQIHYIENKIDALRSREIDYYQKALTALDDEERFLAASLYRGLGLITRIKQFSLQREILDLSGRIKSAYQLSESNYESIQDGEYREARKVFLANQGAYFLALSSVNEYRSSIADISKDELDYLITQYVKRNLRNTLHELQSKRANIITQREYALRNEVAYNKLARNNDPEVKALVKRYRAESKRYYEQSVKLQYRVQSIDATIKTIEQKLHKYKFR